MNGMAMPPDEAGKRWRSRPVLSAAVRAVAVVGPAALAFVVAVEAARLVPAPTTVWPSVLRWVVITMLSVGVLIAAQRVARRLLPLAALLKLSLLFPDHAPQRYKIARKVGRPKDLELQLQRARRAGRPGAEILGPQSVLELVAALSVHDRATRGHSERVRIFTDLIGEELKLSQHDQDRLRWAALLHDVGKLKVPAAILRKPGKPSPAEWTTLKEHPTQGSLLIAPIAPWLGPWALAVEHHHERYDGAGYPHGLHGEQISLGGRIVAVADSYETMTAARPYKRPISPGAARNELVACSGAQFDPVIVRAFLNVSLGRLWQTVGFSAFISQIPLIPQVTSGLGVAGAQMAPLAAKSALGFALVTGAAAAVPSQSAASGPVTHLTAHTQARPGRSHGAKPGHDWLTASTTPSHPGKAAPPPHPGHPPKAGPKKADPPPHKPPRKPAPPPKPKPAPPHEHDTPDGPDNGPGRH